MNIPFYFNAFSALLLPAFVQGLIFSTLLWFRYWAEKRISDLFSGGILMILTLKISFWMLGFAGWYDRKDVFTTFMFYFPFNNFILIGPMLYFYFLSLVNAQFKIARKLWIHLFVPFVYILLIISKLLIDFMFFYPFPNQEEFQYGCKGYLAELDKSDILVGGAYVTFFFYIWLIFNKFRHYQHYIQEEFSFEEEVNFKWFYQLLIVSAMVVFIFFGMELLSIFSIDFSYNSAWYGYFLLGIAIYYLSIRAYFYPNLSQLNKLQFAQASESPPNQNDPIEHLEEWKQNILVWMQEKRPFLNPNLSLHELAQQLQTPHYQLSKLINEGFEKNFNDFINQFRIQHIIQKLHSGEHLRHTLLGLAIDSGFNSKTTFNRAFKKHTSLSPQEYIKKNIKK
jgi:AraC-like DNA-binding protein